MSKEMLQVPCKVFDYTDDYRYMTFSGIKIRHLADIHMLGRTFVFYQNTADGKKYIEEKISNKISDVIYGDDLLIYIDDDNLFLTILNVLQKELKETP